MFIRYLVFSSSLLMLVACSREVIQKNLFESTKTLVIQQQATQALLSEYVYLTDEDRARLFDIPFTIDSKPWYLQIPDVQERFIVQYISQISIKNLIAFYSVNMQSFGWQEIEKFISPEVCLIFQMPTRRCIIYIRSDKEQHLVTILVGPTGIVEY